MKTRESEEMYLETIFLMKKKGATIRSVDIVEELNYAKSSVSRAVNLLQKKGYVDIGADGEIALTEQGAASAQKIYKRHKVLTEALIAIGVSEREAEENACRIEHIISDRAFSAIETHLERHKN